MRLKIFLTIRWVKKTKKTVSYNELILYVWTPFRRNSLNNLNIWENLQQKNLLAFFNNRKRVQLEFYWEKKTHNFNKYKENAINFITFFEKGIIPYWNKSLCIFSYLIFLAIFQHFKSVLESIMSYHKNFMKKTTD